MLIWLSESSLLGWFSWLSKGLIIKEWKAWLSLIIKISSTSLPTFSNSDVRRRDDSPDQTVNRRKIECQLPLLYTTIPTRTYGLWPTGQPVWKNILIVWEFDSREKGDGSRFRRDEGKVVVPRRNTHLCHCRTQSVIKRIVPHPSYLTRPMRRVELTKI